MEIIWKDYKITVNKSSWDLHKKNIVTQERIDHAKKSGKPTKKKVGDYSWSDEGFFTKLDGVIDTLIRLETNDEKGISQLSDYLIRWNNIIQNFTQQCEVIKKGE